MQGNLIGTDVTGTARLEDNNRGVLIDGTAGNTIDGTNAAARNIISGNGFGGVFIQDSNAGTIVDSETIGNIIQGNYIGLDITGNTNVRNGSSGVQDEVFNTIIGGITATPGTAPGNVIVGDNGTAVIRILVSDGALIQGNLLGTNASGTAGLVADGLVVSGATRVTIGGTTPGAGNVISGMNMGLRVRESSGTVIQGNFIGTDITGTVAVPNADWGVNVSDSPDTLIGGTDAGAGNLISGNSRVGIRFTDSPSSGVSVQGNLIGTEIDAASPLGNGRDGVWIDLGNSDITIGGTQAGAANVIAFNGRSGVLVGATEQANIASTGNAILGNSIFQNEAAGDRPRCDPSGFQIGDWHHAQRPWRLRRRRQQPAELPRAHVRRHQRRDDRSWEGTLNSLTDSEFRIEFYSSTTLDPTGFGEGENFLGFVTAATDANGNAAFTFNSPTWCSPGSSSPPRRPRSTKSARRWTPRSSRRASKSWPKKSAP